MVVREGTIVVHGPDASPRARTTLEKQGVELVEVAAAPGGRIDVTAALDALGGREIRSLLVEGGGLLHGAFVTAAVWERLHVFQAPKLLGEGRPMVAGVDWPRVADAPVLRVVSRKRLGDDLLTVYARQ